MYKIEAETYTSSNEFHFVKLKIDGVYISGIKVSVSKKIPGTLWIQMPSFRIGSEYKRYIEMERDSPLGKAMYKAINDLLEPELLGTGNHSIPEDEVVLEDIDDSPIDLSDIPF